MNDLQPIHPLTAVDAAIAKQPLRLSHSSLELLNTCERKFQLEKLLVSGQARDENEHTIYGRAFGAGVASYMVYQNRDKALYDAWFEYFPDDKFDTRKKSQAQCIMALEGAFGHLDQLLRQYEVVSFNGVPAAELGFRLTITKDYYFVGWIDVVLRDRFTGLYSIMEVKTTGLQLTDLSPLYQNSGQALGYSIALDRIVGEKQSSYGVLYFICQLGKGEGNFQCNYHVMPFKKTLLDRLNWFLTLGFDVKKLQIMAEIGSYPKRGGACLHFMRPCKYFGICGLHTFDQQARIEPDKENYSFVYDMDELVQEHVLRISNQ